MNIQQVDIAKIKEYSGRINRHILDDLVGVQAAYRDDDVATMRAKMIELNRHAELFQTHIVQQARDDMNVDQLSQTVTSEISVDELQDDERRRFEKALREVSTFNIGILLEVADKALEELRIDQQTVQDASKRELYDLANQAYLAYRDTLMEFSHQERISDIVEDLTSLQDHIEERIGDKAYRDIPIAGLFTAIGALFAYYDAASSADGELTTLGIIAVVLATMWGMSALLQAKSLKELYGEQAQVEQALDDLQTATYGLITISTS